ncbi:transcription elongation factor GreA [Candidatus Kuenenbacteria bacterium]|nr:transcription elongation factor GreA [Candidatus Kuenenbacteria bacterium]
MQVPYRKPGKYAATPTDFHITAAKREELQKKLAELLSKRPYLIADMQKHASNGDFSENAPYQIAKGQLRSLNRRIDEIEEQLRHAEIIDPNAPKDAIQIGCSVDLEINGGKATYQILGSSETDPKAGIISHRSPIGSALIGRRTGETITIKNNNREISCLILKIY